MADEPRGILRNKSEASPLSDSAEPSDFDRQEVIKNTQLNAQIFDELKSKGDQIRAKIASEKVKRGEDPRPDHLKWDELNLYRAEQDKSSTMKIDEPKTPYENGFDPNGEYYRDDDDDDKIPEFDLGDGEDNKEELPALNGGEVLKNEENEDDDSEEPQPVSAEDRHKKFEEMRKAHYHMKAAPLGQKIEVSDDEED